ncbi:MAG: hypothetical protein Q8R82_06510 [Hyphomonadaceae bacterium]|nr:hypothetical protein [Hyphomonadaceae bacterium]
MGHFYRLLTAAALLAAGCATQQTGASAVLPAIAISAPASGNWIAAYTLPAPATELVFDRSPDASRTVDWKAPEGFEIIRTDAGERVRRRDGAAFSEVALSIPPVYRDLPKDYGPFSPFGDGGILTYTGRFFACGGPCVDYGWRMKLSAPGRSILMDGKVLSGAAEWLDGDSGRNIYIGETRTVETADFIAVIDNALPGAIRSQLAEQLPVYLHHFAERMGALPARPMLFASYDLAHRDGFGRQGGTLPGQVFVHFYGSAWPEQMAKPGFAEDLGWHFAHEAAHLYQRQTYAEDQTGAWIHEGGAEAFAALALRSTGQAEAANAIVAAAAGKCTAQLAGRSVHAALEAGVFDVAYTCGLRANLALDAELRRVAPKSDGLYSAWTAYRKRVEGRAATEEDFMATVASIGGEATTALLRAMVASSTPDFSF